MNHFLRNVLITALLVASSVPALRGAENYDISLQLQLVCSELEKVQESRIILSNEFLSFDLLYDYEHPDTLEARIVGREGGITAGTGTISGTGRSRILSNPLYRYVPSSYSEASRFSLKRYEYNESSSTPDFLFSAVYPGVPSLLFIHKPDLGELLFFRQELLKDIVSAGIFIPPVNRALEEESELYNAWHSRRYIREGALGGVFYEGRGDIGSASFALVRSVDLLSQPGTLLISHLSLSGCSWNLELLRSLSSEIFPLPPGAARTAVASRSEGRLGVKQQNLAFSMNVGEELNYSKLPDEADGKRYGRVLLSLKSGRMTVTGNQTLAYRYLRDPEAVETEERKEFEMKWSERRVTFGCSAVWSWENRALASFDRTGSIRVSLGEFSGKLTVGWKSGVPVAVGDFTLKSGGWILGFSCDRTGEFSLKFEVKP